MNENASLSMLGIINERVPGISLANALGMLADFQQIFEASETADSIVRARYWAERNFTFNDLSTRKIGVIKEIRNRFSLSLRDAKDIADRLTPEAPSNFFPNS